MAIPEKFKDILNKLKERGFSDEEIKKTYDEIDFQYKIDVANAARKYARKIIYRKEDINIILKKLGQPPTIKQFITIVEISGEHYPCIHSCLTVKDVHTIKLSGEGKAFMFFADEQSTNDQLSIFTKQFPNYRAKRYDENTVELCLSENSPVSIAASMGITSFYCQNLTTNKEKIIGGSERKIHIKKLESRLLEKDGLLRRDNPKSVIPTNVREIRTERGIFLPLPHEPIDYHELFQYCIEFQPSEYQVLTLETVHAIIKRLRTGPRSISTQTLFELVSKRYPKYGTAKKTIESHKSIIDDYIDYLIKNYSIHLKGFSEPDEEGV